jgi:hypothetical protein
VQSDDPAAVTEALVWAKKTHEQLGRLPIKPFQPLSNGDMDPLQQSARISSDSDTPPICAIHNLPMVKVQGKRGEFWSCHEKMADGSWCSYRPSA